MEEQNQKIYLCIDLKSFYASVECVERGLDPMTTDLVVADPERTDKTICLAVSPSLKVKGVKNRCRVFEIPKSMQYIMAPPRMQLYIDYSAEIYGIFLKYIAKSDILVYSIDEAFMDVTHYLSLYKMSARELAETILADVLASTGITATCGIGTNLYLTKIALDITAKHADPGPAGARIGMLDEQRYKETLWSHTPLTDFWQVGPGTAKKLAKYGIMTMGDIALASLQQEDLLYRLFGVDAELLIDHAWGIEPCTMEDIKMYKPKTNCLSYGQVLQSAYSYQKAEIIVKEMTDAMVLDLIAKNLVTSSVTLHIGYDRANVDSGMYSGEVHFDHYGRAVPKPAHGTTKFAAPTSSHSEIMAAVTTLYRKIAGPSLLIRQISLTANDVEEEICLQYDLFTDPVALEEERKMQQALLAIKKKFGKNAILKGIDYEEGATTRDRNEQIGGHKA